MTRAEFFAIIERYQTFQNPTSVEKLDLLAEYCGIRDGTRILDVGCGKAWPLRRWASRYKIEAVGLELYPHFLKEAREQTAAQGLTERLRFVEGPAADFSSDPQRFDVALCLGASFALNGFDSTLDWLKGKVVADGIVAIGEPYALRLPFPDAIQAHYGECARTLAETARKFESRGLKLRTIIDSSRDDWDRYESLHWQAAADWLAEHPDHPDRALFEGATSRYLEHERDFVGWAIFVGRVQIRDSSRGSRARE